MKLFGCKYEISEKDKEINVEFVEPPIGESCEFCKKKIQATDVGIILPYVSDTPIKEKTYHKSCFEYICRLDDR